MDARSVSESIVRALQSIDAAASTPIPRFGARAARATVQDQLRTARTSLHEVEATLRGDAATGASQLTTAIDGIDRAIAAAQSRRGVRELTTMLPQVRSDIEMSTIELYRAGSATARSIEQLSDRVVAGLDEEVRATETARLSSMLKAGAGALDRDACIQLEDLANAPAHLRATQLDDADACLLHNAASYCFGDSTRPSPNWHGWNTFDRLATTERFPTERNASIRLRAIARTADHELTGQDLHDFNGLVGRRDMAHLLRGTTVPSDAALRAERVTAGTPLPSDWVGRDTFVWLDPRRQWPDRTSAEAALFDLFRGATDRPSAGDLRTLSRLAALPDDLRPDALTLRGITPDQAASDLATVAEYFDRDLHPRADWYGYELLNKLHVQANYASAADVRARFETIVEIPTERLEPQDIRDLDGMRQLPAGMRPLLLRPEREMATEAELLKRGQTVVPAPIATRTLEAARLERSLPSSRADRNAWFRDQLRAYTSDQPTDPRFQTLLHERPDLLPDDLSEHDRVRIANDLLTDYADAPATTSARAALEVSRQSLESWEPLEP
ncbi:MAG: hypothetical protein KDC46_11550, partial [Thermoleophilia bacterium]|nr:hypothetical protein [Thermoleophilia bacterium]